MAKKKAFVLRIQPEQIAALERWAQDDFRSINGQIEYLLNEALKSSGRLKSAAKPNPKNSDEQSEVK